MTELELVTVSFKAYRLVSELIAEAAEKEGLSISDFCRETMTERASAVTGRKLPTLPPLQRGRYGNMIAQAATKLGLTRAEFEAKALQEYAAAQLGYTVLFERADPKPEELEPAKAYVRSRSTPVPPAPRKPSGTYSKGGERAPEVVRPKRVTGK
jgi:uncharacterized protein (DUF1778 family)